MTGPGETDPLDIEVTALYGARMKRGLIQVRIGAARHLMTPAKAREIAAFMLEAAGAAEGDEALLAVLERIGTPQELVGQVLIAMRVERTKIDARARDEARRALTEDQSDPDSPS